MSRSRIGIQVGASTPPSEVGSVAAEAERLGYGEIWLAEDYFELGGFVSSSIALAATERIPVGLGVVAAAVRHPSVTAMEIATLAEGFGHRFMAGLGHGSADWIRQMDLQPKSPIGLLREATATIRQLLDGGEVSERGCYFSSDQIRLDHAPAQPVPLFLGVHGPVSLRLSGELANGTLLGWFSSPEYTAWARERINEGRAQANRADEHQLVVLCLLSISDKDPDGARYDLARWSAPALAASPGTPQPKDETSGIESSLPQIGESGNLRDSQPGQHLGKFAAAGSSGSCQAAIQQLIEAGADRVILVPNPAGRVSTAEMVDQIRLASALLSR